MALYRKIGNTESEINVKSHHLGTSGGISGFVLEKNQIK